MEYKQLLAGLFLITIITTGLVLPFQVSALFGVVDTGFFFDIPHTLTTVAGWLAQAWRFVKDKIAKILLANLKKRLLDSLVDATVDWVQNGGDPRFITNLGNFVEFS